MNDEEHDAEALIKEIKRLPVEARRSILWIIENIEDVEKMMNGDKMSKRLIEKYMEQAIQHKDYVLLALMAYKQKKEDSKGEANG